MCEPTTIAYVGLALTAASTAYSLDQQQQQQKAQEKYNEQVYQNEMTAYRYNLANQEAQVADTRADAAEKVNQNALALRRAEATAQVSAAEAGVSGLSVDALLAEMEGQYGLDNTNIYTNSLRQERAIRAGQQANWSGTASTINGLKTPVSPDYLGAALKIGGAAMNTYNTYGSPSQSSRSSGNQIQFDYSGMDEWQRQGGQLR